MLVPILEDLTGEERTLEQQRQLWRELSSVAEAHGYKVSTIFTPMGARHFLNTLEAEGAWAVTN